MQTEAAQVNQNVRYEPDERLSPSLTLGLGFQYAALIVGGIVLTPAIIVRAAGESEAYLTWAVFYRPRGERVHHGDTGRPAWTHRRGISPADGHLRRVYRRLRHRAGAGRPRNAGDPGCYLVTVPVCPLGASCPVPAHHHPRPWPVPSSC